MRRVTHISFSPLGGAGAVAVRLASAQRQLGWEVRFESLVQTPFPRWAGNHPIVAAAAMADYYLVRGSREAAFFSLFRKQHARRLSRRLSGYEGVLHLHLLNGVLWPPAFFALPLEAHKIIWSVQDCWPFTGGCHYTNECDGFRVDCARCPQVRKMFQKAVAACLQSKREALRHRKDLVIVTPSQWARALAAGSSVMRNLPAAVIPNPVDTGQFYPLDKDAVRARWGLDPTAFVIGVGAADLRDERKQIRKTLAILLDCLSQLQRSRPVQVLVFGGGKPFRHLPATFRFMGPSQSPSVLAEWYTAMDVFVSLSRYETFGNMLAEAAACGTPSICLTGSGMAEVVVPDTTGRHIHRPDALPAALADWAANPSQALHMGCAARQYAREHFDEKVVARRFIDAYEDTA